MTDSITTGDAVRIAAQGLQRSVAQFNESSAAVVNSTVEANNQAFETSAPANSPAPIQGKSTQVYPSAGFSSVVQQMVFNKMASVAVIANAAVVRSAYEATGEVSRLVGEAQQRQRIKETLA